MAESREFVEHMEHAGHEGHGKGFLHKYVGITIALLGVLLAFCSALVGAERTELISTMVEQTGTSLRYQTATTKYRMLQAQLQQLHALLPDPAEMKASEEELVKLEGQVTTPELARLLAAVKLESKRVLSTVTPTKKDMRRFATQIRGYKKEKDLVRAWYTSYDAAISAHFHGAERFEWAQLCAEVAIVLASVALLFSASPAWLLAMLLGLGGLGLVIHTRIHVKEQVEVAEHAIHEAKHHYDEHTHAKNEGDEDEQLLREVEGGEGAPAPATAPEKEKAHGH